MHISRVQIANFRNFASCDVPLAKDVVVVGENRAGKSNFIYALRLVLDASLPDAARQLKLADIWDGCDLASAPEIAVHVDFSDFDGDPNLLALLTDYRLAANHQIARLSYVYRKKSTVNGAPTSDADYEFKVFGGGDETRSLRVDLRRRISLDVLHALRDAEGDLATWRSSPLRPLLEDAIGQVPQANLTAIAQDITAATQKLGALAPIDALEKKLRADIASLAGQSHDIKAKLGFAPTDLRQLFRSLGLFIDDGKRSISDASLGSANVALLAIKLAEFAWRRQKNERNYTVLCVEEPEAHLHPHLQRQVFHRLFAAQPDEPRSLVLTTHSPNVASVAPLRSIVLLASTKEGTKAHSLASLPLTQSELDDLQRYLDTTRAEILFSKGVLFVEGDAEVALMPVFAESCKANLDGLGITVCSVGGVNFSPYVKLATALKLPFAVISDWDPVDPKKPLGRDRALNLIDDIFVVSNQAKMTPEQRAEFAADEKMLRDAAAKAGLFFNTSTFEVEVGATKGLLNALLGILAGEGFGAKRQARLVAWSKEPDKIDPEQLLAMVADVGKGRLAGKLAPKAAGLPPPAYIKAAIESLVSRA